MAIKQWPHFARLYRVEQSHLIALLTFYFFSSLSLPANAQFYNVWPIEVDSPNGTISLDFNNSLNVKSYPPLVVPNIRSDDHSTVICDSSGWLVLYRGFGYYNSKFVRLGYAENGRDSESLLIPNFDNDQIVYNIKANFDQLSGGEGVNVVTIDLKGANDTGEVVKKTVVYPDVLRLSARANVAATFHQNQKEIWFGVNYYDTTLIFLFDSTQQLRLKSKVPFQYIFSQNQDLTFSPWSNRGFMSCNLFEFNNATGKISNVITLFDHYTTFPVPDKYEKLKAGCAEFSPNGRFLYVTEVLGTSQINNADTTYLVQYDLREWDAQAIAASRKIIHRMPTHISTYGRIRLAPNNKLYYMIGEGDEYLAVVNQPDLPYPQCQFEPKGVYLKGHRLNRRHSMFPTIITSSPRKLELGPDTTLCPGDTLVLRPKLLVNDQLAWNTGSTADTLAITQAGTYHVTLRNGPLHLHDTITVKYHPKEELLSLQDSTFCDSVSLQITSGLANAQHHLWSTGDTTATLTLKQPGTFWVQSTSENHCKYTDTISISMAASPRGLRVRDTTLCTVERLPLSLGNPQYSYNWTQAGLQGHQPVFTQSGTYQVSISNQFCTRVDSIEIHLVEDDTCLFYFYIPTAFTPDGNDLNEYFRPVYHKAEVLRMQVFNRWGECVYNETELGSGWDGKFKGRTVPVGVYLVRVEYLSYEHGTPKRVFLHSRVQVLK